MPKKTINYVQLRTFRQWPNQSTYLPHLEAGHSKIKPIAYHIDRVLNNKWIEIQRPEFNQQEIRNEFIRRSRFIDSKSSYLTEQFDENNREIFNRAFEIIDQLVFLFQEIENGEKMIYEYRLDFIKYQFEQERQSLRYLFIDQEFKEFDNQINVLNTLEQEDILQQSIQFQLNQRQLEEQFFKDITILHGQVTTRIVSINEIVHTNLPGKHCHHLIEKTRQGQERIDQEVFAIGIVKRKIRETNKHLQQIDANSVHLYDKLNQLKQCSTNREEKVKKQQNIQIIFRRLSVLIDHVQKACEKKFIKAERLLFLINQCERLELDDEKLLFSSTKLDLNPILSQVSYLHHCQFENDLFVDEFSFFWKRFAHVQLDLFIRMEEKSSRKKLQNFLRKQWTSSSECSIRKIRIRCGFQ